LKSIIKKIYLKFVKQSIKNKKIKSKLSIVIKKGSLKIESRFIRHNKILDWTKTITETIYLAKEFIEDRFEDTIGADK